MKPLLPPKTPHEKKNSEIYARRVHTLAQAARSSDGRLMSLLPNGNEMISDTYCPE
jgi:hypothetical protein